MAAENTSQTKRRESPRKTKNASDAVAGSQRRTVQPGRSAPTRALPQLGQFSSDFELLAYCFQLDAIRDRLNRQTPTDEDSLTPAQRHHLRSARRFLKAAETSLTRLMRAHNDERQRSFAKGRGRRGTKLTKNRSADAA
jgi:hypothetical protein